VNAGTVGFNFSNLAAFAKTGVAIRGAGVEFNGIYALNRRTGELLWHFDTKGAVMPTPALDNGRLIFSTGAGHVYAIDAKSAETIWSTTVGGMANMSAPAVEGGKVYVGMAAPDFLFCLDEQTGKVLWKGRIPDTINTGMGDVPPATADGIVVMDGVSTPQTADGKMTVDTSVRAFDANTGKPLWTHMMGRGPKPPAFKGGVPMIHEGVVYIGSPVNSVYQALDLKTGKLLWTWNVPDPGPAGAGRSPATHYDGALYISTGTTVHALDPQSGKPLGEKKLGGRFGLVSPTIVGGTIYLGNSWDWIIALPVSEVNPKYVSAPGGRSGTAASAVPVADSGVKLSEMSAEQKKQEQQYFRDHSFEFSSLFSKHHPGPYWILARAKEFQLSPEQSKQQEELKNGMAAGTIAGNIALGKAYEKYAADAAAAEPSAATLNADIEAIGKAQTHLAQVMIPYHLKAYAALNPAQQSIYKKLLAQTSP
jgi:outer membrane protein assembly factor BamB